MHPAPWAARTALLMATATALLVVARATTHHHSQQQQQKQQHQHQQNITAPAMAMATTTSALELLNPWLSACDLVQPAASDDLQGACMATPDASLPRAAPARSPSSFRSRATKLSCPPPCAAATTNTTNQCLVYLEEAHKGAVCDGAAGGGGRRLRQLRALRLRHCCEHAVVAALRPRERLAVAAGGAPCRRHLHALLEIDALAARISCEFTEVLTRYDCAQPYSIVYHCDDCKEAYRRWVCSSLVPHLTETGGRVRPCRSVCQAVEQRCPYLLPGDRAPAHPTQYAGEPTFLCLDPNIPETGVQRERSSHGNNECCYTYCGGPGRPPCAHCPRGASNASWGPVACAAPGATNRPSGACRLPSSATTTAAATQQRGAPLLLLLSLGTLVTRLLRCSLLMCVQCVRTAFVPARQTRWRTVHSF